MSVFEHNPNVDIAPATDRLHPLHVLVHQGVPGDHTRIAVAGTADGGQPLLGRHRQRLTNPLLSRDPHGRARGSLSRGRAAAVGILGVSPTEQRVRLGHVGTTVRIQELGSGPAVLFVHGGSTCGTSWADLVARLDGFRCLLLDRPGTGLSDPLPAPITGLDGLRVLADSLVIDVLDALELETASLVATSFGGWFAFRAALAHPARIRPIVEFGWSAGAPVPRLPALMRLGTRTARG